MKLNTRQETLLKPGKLSHNMHFYGNILVYQGELKILIRSEFPFPRKM